MALSLKLTYAILEIPEFHITGKFLDKGMNLYHNFTNFYEMTYILIVALKDISRLPQQIVRSV